MYAVLLPLDSCAPVSVHQFTESWFKKAVIAAQPLLDEKRKGRTQHVRHLELLLTIFAVSSAQPGLAGTKELPRGSNLKRY